MTQSPLATVCYRHPDRITGVRCARCERGICSDCMIPAPVGFQCPECVAAARTPSPRTVAGGTIVDRPIVTYVLIAINVVVYAAQYLLPVNPLTGLDPVTTNFAMWPNGIAFNGEWWRLGTAAFLHGSILHLAFNMYVLFALGPTLERILGHLRYVILYGLAAIGGGVASYVFSSQSTLSVGASGAIFGLMGALVVAGRRLRFDVTQVLVLIGVNIVIGFLPGGNVDWRAHLGGLITGAVVAALMVLPGPRYRNVVQVVGIAGLIVVFALMVAARTAQITA